MIRTLTQPDRAREPLRVSFEFFPPKSEGMSERLWDTIQRLEPMSPDFVSVTYGAGGSTRERTHDTVRRIVANEGVERMFPLHSPRMAKIEVVRRADARRAKLYYLRDRFGKARRLRDQRRGLKHTAKQ